MKMKKIIKTTVALLAATVSLAVINIQARAADSIVKVDGSSTVYPITEAVAEEFQKAKGGAVKVTVGISGTGGGFKKFCRGETDISDASRAIKESEMADCKTAGIEFIELPVAYDALTVVIHPSNTWASTMTVADLKKIWEPTAQGVVVKWNQVRPSFPDKPIKLYGPGSDSGTFDYFTDAINGKEKASRGDFTASEDDNVLVQGVSSDPNALGYFGFAYYVENQGRLKAVAIDNGKGGILPSRQSVENGTYKPLGRPIFIYVKKESYAKNPAVKEFVEFYINNAEKLVAEVKYVPFDKATYQTVLSRLTSGIVGTSFSGVSLTGTTVGEVAKRGPQM